MLLPCIPSEITDRIIALLWPDMAALRCCTMVCRRWLPASRYQLFMELNLRNHIAYDLLVSNILHSDEARSSLMATHRIILDESRVLNLDTKSERCAAMRAHRFSHDFAGHLPGLRDLELRGVEWDLDIVVPHSSVHLAFTRFNSVRRLVLHRVNFPTFGLARRLLSALRSLESLVVSETFARPEQAAGISPVATRRPQRPALTSLELAGVMNERFVDCLVHFLCRTPTSSSLRVLRLSSERPRQSDGVPSESSGSVFESLGSCVETLALRDDHAGDGDNPI
ncbi:hypothetical protein OH76DRAFT_1056812 [Lentinus brumalis]|uniref:F-box domain-containing protein n=1 Tax=Lentinus brumalis TaxID=2498619 RepID=A0A371DNB9_9APHY|nr:hypothetical protein OH76DRAFT_1056812 [Polyporus brumalis]